MNVVVFCSDTFRFDHLGGLGAQPVQTPNLDKLVQESALFTDYRLCSFPTVLNRIEVFSGRYTFPVIGWGAQPYQYPVLAEAFSHHGYQTALISDNPHIIRKGFGFERGFGYVDKILGQTDDEFLPESAPMAELPCPLEKLEPRESRLERYRRNAQFFQQQGSSTTEVVARSTIKWLKAQPNPFFLWVDAFDPHEPWNAPSRYLEKYPWNAEGDMVVWPRDGKTDRYTQADVANMQSLYKAEITQTDYWLGELMGELRDSKTLENTIVIFCSDHGYYLGEHGFVGKLFKKETGPNVIYEELAHVPLLIRHPDGRAAGQKLAGFCQPADLYPTLLELAGLPPVSWTQGFSLVPRLAGAPSRQQFAVGGCHPHTRNVSKVSVWSKEWSFLYAPYLGFDDSELYDRQTDPQETKNLISANLSIAREHFGALQNWLQGLGISASKRQHLLTNQRSNWTRKTRQRLWLFGNKLRYFHKYRTYARPKLPANRSCSPVSA